MRYEFFGTPGIDPRDRFEYWRTWYSQAVDVPMWLEPTGKLPADFQASAEVLGDRDVDIVELRCGPAAGSWRQEATEDAARLRLVILAPAPGGAGRWHGHGVALDHGCAVLLGGTDGWWRTGSGLRGMQVNVPRAAVPVSDAQLEVVNARRLLDGNPVFASLVRPVLVGMAGRLKELAGADAAGVGAVWVSLLTLLTRSLTTETAASVDGADVALARRVQARRYIGLHLADPRLSPADVAAALHISRRTLYAALAADSRGIAAQIRQQRLQQARALLADPACNLSITQIAARVGLPGPAHFSRLFRAEYGHSPRELRAHRGAGTGRRDAEPVAGEARADQFYRYTA